MAQSTAIKQIGGLFGWKFWGDPSLTKNIWLWLRSLLEGPPQMGLQKGFLCFYFWGWVEGVIGEYIGACVWILQHFNVYFAVHFLLPLTCSCLYYLCCFSSDSCSHLQKCQCSIAAKLDSYNEVFSRFLVSILVVSRWPMRSTVRGHWSCK